MYWSGKSKEDRLEEHAGQQADQPPRGTLGSPHVPPPCLPGQSIRHHHPCLRSHTHGRPRYQKGLLRRRVLGGKFSLKRSSRPDKERRNCQSRAPVAAAETILQETAEKVGGLSTRKYRDCTDENYAEIQKLLQVKRSCHTKLLSRPDDHATERAYKIAYSNANSRLRTNAGSIRMKRYSSTPKIVTLKPSTKLCVLSTAQRTRSRLLCARLMAPQH